MIRRLHFLFCLQLLILTACSPSEAGLDAGLFTGKPCSPPCWQNLIPDRSTSENVDQFLNSLSEKDWPDRETKTYLSGCKSLILTGRPGSVVPYNLELDIENGYLKFIQTTRVVTLPFTLRLSHIVDQIGPPEYIESILAVGPDADAYFLEVYYPHQGLAFILSPGQKDVGQLKRNVPIVSIQYFPPGDILAYEITRYSCSMGKEDAMTFAQDRIARFVRPWTGFGKVEVIQTR